MAVRKIVQDSTYPATQPDPLETLPYWGKGTDEDITSLPPGWEARVTSDGRVFFVNHNKRVTQWTYPKTNMKYRVLPYLPYGWQVFKDEDNVLVYVDHMDHICTKIDPRLLSKTAYDYPDEYGIRSFNPLQHRIKPYARASDVLEGVDLKGKVAMVTGASSGLGFETASCLAGYGARVIMVSRDPIRSTEALKSIQDKNPLAHVECHEMDLGSLSSVREFARKFIASGLPLDILICNGGVFEPSFELSKDGLEKHFAVNYFGHFYLIRLLKDVLIESKPSRVVIVSSDAHR
jgi:WW domain-containing oxidoreductase